MSKAVAVVIVNWNTAGYTSACIDALHKNCDNSNFDIILLDNGSTDDSVAVLTTKFPNLVFIDNKENLGFSEGHNRGLRYSINNGYAYSLVVNNDTLVDEDLISKLILFLDNNTAVAAVQPAIFWMHNRNAIWNGPCYFNKITGKALSKTSDSLKALTKPINVDWVTGCCFLVRNSALKSTTLFNKKFFFYFEDVELSFQLREQGFKLSYLPTAKLYHEAGVTGKSKTPQKEGTLNPFIHFLISRNHIWFLRKYGKKLCYPIYFLYNGSYFFVLFMYFAIKGKTKKRQFLIKGIKEGLFTPRNIIWPNQ